MSVFFFSDCQKLLTEESGSLRSPGFPDNYPDSTDCWTLIQVSNSKKVILFFDSIDMEYGDNCTFDFVRVLDGETRSKYFSFRDSDHSIANSVIWKNSRNLIEIELRWIWPKLCFAVTYFLHKKNFTETAIKNLLFVSWSTKRYVL